MTSLRLRHVFAAVLALCLLAVGATDAHASHFRYGTMRWEVIPTVPPNQPGQTRIKVTAETAWRYSYPGWGSTPTLGVPLSTGSTVTVQRTADFGLVASAGLSVTPSSINTSEDWFVGSTLLQFQFATTNLPVRIFFEGGTNRRVSNLADENRDDNFRVETVMSATPNAAAPVASILPIITVGYPLPAATFFIPAADVEGDTMTWSIAPLSRSLLTTAVPNGLLNNFPTLSINPLTGEVTWNTSLEHSPNVPQGPPPLIFSQFYAVQFIVTDSKGGETPVDAFLRVIVTVPDPPVADINGSEDQHTVDVRPNNLVSFVLTGTDDDAGATVTLTSGNLPPGATMTPSLPTGGTSPRTSTFNWTPTFAQAGNSYTVSFAVTDEFANQDTISAVIRVLENFPPEITCPADRTVEATGPGGADNVTVEVNVNDSDPDPLTVRWFVDVVPAPVQTDTIPAGPHPPGGHVVSRTQSYGFLPAPHIIFVDVTDGHVFRNCTTRLTVVDTTPPVLNLPPTIIVEATGPNGAIATFVVTATDLVDPNPVVTCSPLSGSVFPLGDTPVSCTATDASGNTSQPGTFLVTVQDTRPPVLNLPATITVEALGPNGTNVNFVVTATDPGGVDPNPVVTCSPLSGSLFPLGDNPVSCTATDDSGNTSAPGIFHVIVQDTLPPVLNLPATITVQATGPNGATVNFVVTATDPHNVDPNPVVTCTPASGSLFPLGDNPVSCTATDDSGNTSAPGIFHVIVQDTLGPVVTVPGTITGEATGPGGRVVTFTATAFDDVDGNITPTCTPASGSMFPLADTTVTCTATDSHGNTGSAQFHVIVVDTTPPVITGFGNITVPGSGGGAFVPWPPPTAVDLVDGVRPVTCLPPSGSFFPMGTTLVRCTASDTRNNTSEITFTVTVITGDDKPPKVCLTLSPGTLWPPNHKMRTIQVILRVTDNEDPTPTCTITNVTSTEPVTGIRYGNTTPDWTFSGLNLQLRAERYSKHGRTYTVTVLCSDDAGNTTTTKGTVRVPHDQGHHLVDGDQNTNNGPNQSGKCCKRPRPDNDDDDDDDDDHFWTNDPDRTGGGGHNPPPCPNPDIDDDDDDHGDDDDDDDHLTIKPDASGTN